MIGDRGESVKYALINDPTEQRLAGATLLIFANKQDLSGSLALTEIRDVRWHPQSPSVS